MGRSLPLRKLQDPDEKGMIHKAAETGGVIPDGILANGLQGIEKKLFFPGVRGVFLPLCFLGFPERTVRAEPEEKGGASGLQKDIQLVECILVDIPQRAAPLQQRGEILLPQKGDGPHIVLPSLPRASLRRVFCSSSRMTSCTVSRIF